MALLWMIARGVSNTPPVSNTSDWVSLVMSLVPAALVLLTSIATIYFTNHHQSKLAQEQHLQKMEEDEQTRRFALEDAKRERLREAARHLLDLAQICQNAVRAANINVGWGKLAHEEAQTMRASLQDSLEKGEEQKWVGALILEGAADAANAFKALADSASLYFLNASMLNENEGSMYNANSRNKDKEQVEIEFNEFTTLLVRYLSLPEK